MRLVGSTNSNRGHGSAVGILLANLGTPAAPTPAAVRRWLREFLSDPRVVELPRPLWWMVLHVLVLTTRPRRVAGLYRRIWTSEGSPLLVISRRQGAALEEALSKGLGSPLRVAVGMRYGSPSLAAALAELRESGCQRLLVLPLYPQYSSATTGSTLAAVFAQLSRWRWIPEMRTVTSYHDHPSYIAALATSIRQVWQAQGEPSRLLVSFHGIPRRGVLAGDPYYGHCQGTARLLREALDWPEARLGVAFQSRFGREQWLEPYTDVILRQWGSEGVASVDVVCPGFAADCLETLEEIAQTSRELFLRAGGGRFRYLPALNDRVEHIAALTELCLKHLEAWVVPPPPGHRGWPGQHADELRQRGAALAPRWEGDLP